MANTFADWVKFIVEHPAGEAHPSPEARLNLIKNGSIDEVRLISMQNGGSGSEAQVAAMKKEAQSINLQGPERQG